MKKIVCLLSAVVLLACLACPVFAEEFVPSISEKSAPTLIDGAIIKDGQVIDDLDEDCLIITPVAEAEESEHIPDDAENTLMMVFGKLNDGSMTLPYDKVEGVNPENMVVRDLFDVSWRCSDHPDIVAPAGVHVELTFDLGVEKDVQVVAMTYKHDQWNPIVSIVNNGDGTVTCVFEDFCPVAFAVSTTSMQTPAQTGDDFNLVLWISVLVAAAAVLVVLVFVGRKYANKAK